MVARYAFLVAVLVAIVFLALSARFATRQAILDGVIPQIIPAHNRTGVIPQIIPAYNLTVNRTLAQILPAHNRTGVIPQIIPAYTLTVNRTLAQIIPAHNRTGVIPQIISAHNLTVDLTVNRTLAQRAQVGLANEGKRLKRRLPKNAKWPSIFLLGVQKSGSTSMASLLFGHPQICWPLPAEGEPSYFAKEPHFFDKNFKKGIITYLKKFDANERCWNSSFAPVYRLDATPSYINSEEAMEKMHKHTPDRMRAFVKFIVVLREPVSRDLSWFNQHRAIADRQGSKGDPSTAEVAKTGWKRQDFDNFTSFVDRRLQIVADEGHEKSLFRGRYASQLKRLWSLFPRENTIVLNFDTLRNDFRPSLARIAEFLDMDMDPWRNSTILPHANEIGGAHKMELKDVAPAACEKLRDFFHDEMEELYELLQQPGSPPQQPPFPRFSNPCADQNSSRPSEQNTTNH